MADWASVLYVKSNGFSAHDNRGANLRTGQSAQSTRRDSFVPDPIT